MGTAFIKLMALAAKHYDELEATGWWAHVESSTDPLYVRLRYGVVHGNGDREEAIGTRHYHIDADTGDAAYWTAVHP